MRMEEALKIAATGLRPKGYRVSYSRVEGRFLESGHFPECGEPLIPSEEEAWALASAFALRTWGKYVDIFVVDEKWMPIPGYEHKKISNR